MGKSLAIMPYSVLVEVVAAIDEEPDQGITLQVEKKELLIADSVSFVIFDKFQRIRPLKLRRETGFFYRLCKFGML